MAHFFGMMKLGAPEQWRGLAGEDKWKATRSAYELAYSWHGSDGIPREIVKAFNDSGIVELSRLKLEIGFVEKPTFLDTPVGPSMTDIMGYARNAAGDPVILAVEGKATESFGLPVHAWVRGDTAQVTNDTKPRESRLRRLAYLSTRLGMKIDEDSTLYYQLLHRTVAGVMEAALNGAKQAVLLVHSFAPDDTDVNWDAYTAFIKALGARSPTKGQVSGPITLPGIDVSLYSLWHQDRPK